MGAAINLATTYSETDPNSRITLTTVTCAGAGLRRDEAAYVQKDWGAAYFGDFVHDFDSAMANPLANGSKLILWGVSDTANAKSSWTGGLYLQIDGTSTTAETFTLGEIGGSTTTGASHTRAAWYWRIERNGTTLTAKRASSAANRTAGIWVETLTLTVATTTYRYQFAMSTISEANTTAITISTSNFKGTKMTSAGTPFDTAYMAGASSGNWDAGATWGNTGTTKGTDFPGTAADVFNIDAGDTVTYNVSETNALGAGVCWGTLTFKKDSNTKLIFGQVQLIIKTGGTLAIGTVANPIDSTHTAELYFTSTSDIGAGLQVDAGGACSIEGVQMHGGTYRTYLIAAWSAGQTFTVKGDVTAKWVAGQTVLVHMFPAAAGAQKYGEFTIASMAANGADTDITISEAAPGVTYRSGGFVYNTARNVKLGKTSATRTLFNINTNRPTFVFAASGTTLRECELAGVYYFGMSVDAVVQTAVGVIVRNSNQCFGSTGSYGRYDWTDCLLMSVGVNIYRTGFHSLFTRVHFTASATISSMVGGAIDSSEFIDCVWGGFNYTSALLISYNSRFFGCEWVDQLNGPQENSARGNYFFNCLFGKHAHEATNTSLNTTDVYNPSTGGITGKFFNCWFGTEDGTGIWPKFSIDAGGSGSEQSDLCSMDHNQVAGAMQRYHGVWRYKRNTTTTRGGGAAASMEIYGLDKCEANGIGAPAFEWTEFDVGASAITRSIYILGGGWAAWPTAAEVWFEAEYYDEAGTNHRVLVKSTEVMTDNVTWTKLSVTFTPGKSGYVNYRFFVAVLAGTTSTKIYVDPVLNDA